MNGHEIEVDELGARLDDAALTIFDVRTLGEYDGSRGHHCDPRQGHIPGAVHVEVGSLLRCRTREEVREVVALPEGAEIAAYCHSGARSATAVQILRAAGYDARNYSGSWHEWSRTELPIEEKGG